MTNIDRPNLTFGAQPGRRLLERVSATVETRVKTVAASRPFVLFVSLAVVLLGLYYFVIAAPLYVSTTSFSIRGREPTPMIAGGLLSMVGGSTNTGMETAEVNQYIMSYDMVEKLDQRFHLRELYSHPRLDFARHMSPSASREDFLGFYRKLVKVRTDHDTNIVNIEVSSFDPKSAQQIAQAILEFSGNYVEGLSQTVRRDSLKASEQELHNAEAAVRDSRLAMTRFRTSSGMVDPVTTAAGTSGNMMSLQNQIQQAKAEMASLMTFSTPNSPQIQQLNARVAALEGQVAQARSRISEGGRDPSLAQRLYDYEGLLVANEYAEKQLLAALSAYDTARAMAGQRERYLVPVIGPHLPDRPSQPHRLLEFLESLVVLVAGYGVIALGVAGVRDHHGI